MFRSSSAGVERLCERRKLQGNTTPGKTTKYQPSSARLSSKSFYSSAGRAHCFVRHRKETVGKRAATVPDEMRWKEITR